MAKKCNWIVCGRFHYPKYLPYISHDAIEVVYFAHRVGSSMGVPADKAKNIFLKEYFLQACLRVLPDRLRLVSIYLSHAIWAFGLWFSFRPALINLVLLHGASRGALRRCLRAGVSVVGEAVNAHPDYLQRLLNAECDRLGLDRERVAKRECISQEIALCDLIVCPSQSIAASYASEGVDKSKLKVIPYGVGFNAIAQQGRTTFPPLEPSEAVRILVVGQITVRKAQHQLLEFLDRFSAERSTKFDVCLVGAANSRYLETLNAVPRRFKHVRHVPNEQIETLMQGYDIVALPSLEDGFGLVIGEAIQAGVRVLVSQNAGASTTVESGGGGCTYAFGRYDEFALALSRLIDGRTVFRYFGAHSWRDYADELVGVLQQLERH